MTLNKKLALGLIPAIIIVILNDMILNDVPEIVIWGDEGGAILSNLSLAYISGWMFYYVVVVLQEKKDERNIKPTIIKLNSEIIKGAKNAHSVLVHESKQSSKHQHKWENMTEESLLEITSW